MLPRSSFQSEKYSILQYIVMVCILVPPKPAKFSVFADDDGNVYFNWTIVSNTSGYTLYWCRRHVHVHQCAVCIISASFSSCCAVYGGNFFQNLFSCDNEVSAHFWWLYSAIRMW